MKYSDIEIIEGIKKGDTAIFKYVLKKYFPYIKKHICKNHGTFEDSEDVLQEAMCIIYKCTHKNTREKFQPYFMGICKKIWLKNLWKQNKISFTPLSESKTDHFTEDVFQEIENEITLDSKHKVFTDEFEKLSEEKKKILLAQYEKKSAREVAAELNLSYDYVRQKKVKSMQSLMNKIKNRLLKDV